MKKSTFNSFILILLTIFSINVFGQTTVKGRVTDEENGTPLLGASVVVKGSIQGVVTDLTGRYSIDLPKNSTLIFSFIGFASQEIVVGSQTTIDVSLEPGIDLGKVVVSASRREERIIEAPASISVIDAKRINQSIVVSPLQLMKNTLGVQINEHSAGRMSINLRGQSQTFFSGIYVAKDYRPLTQPGSGSFFNGEHSLSPLDMDRVEVVRGPSSALYGPGVTEGVVHFITKSPFKHPGTSIELGSGTLNSLNGALRHAGHNDNNTFGYKVNAYYRYSSEWPLDIYNDPDYAQTAGRLLGVDVIQSAITGEPLITGILEDGLQDYMRNYSVEGSLFFQSPTNNNNLVISSGYTKVDHVFFTLTDHALRRPDNIYVQARGSIGNTFANVSYTSSQTGDEVRNAAAFYRSVTTDANGVRNTSITQKEAYGFTEAQLQHRFDLASLSNTKLLVGGEMRLLSIDGGIFGRNKGNTPYDLYGVYAQSNTPLGKKLDMTLALRYDYYSVLDETSLAPRVAFVYKPNKNNSFRTSYNQANTAPSGLTFYLDLELGPAMDNLGNIIGWTRLIGSATEIHTYNNPQVDWGGTANALGITDNGLSLSHQAAIAAAAAAAGITVDVTAVNTSTDLTPNIVNQGGAASVLVDAQPLKLQQNQTYEIGYTGKLSDKIQASVDVYYADISNASAVNTNYGRFIGNTGLAASVKNSTAGLGLNAEDQAALEAELDNLFTGNLLGTVLSDAVQDSEVLNAGHSSGAPYYALQYFSASSIDYFGYDVQLEFILNRNFDLTLNYSGLSQTEFISDEGIRYVLNTPANKLRASLGYQKDKFSVLADYQYNQEFTVFNGVFSGVVPTRNTADLSLGYKFTDKLMLLVSGTNIFNQKYQAFPGTYKIGSQVLGKVRLEL
ncbi:MAG: TonB-dependent receptor [Chitinophagales bacterium]